MEALTVERSQWVAAPPDRVWRAITEPAQLAQWYAVGCPWEIPVLRPGATVKFHNTPEDVQTAVIEAVEAPREWRLRWTSSADFPALALVTTFRLEPENGGTRVTIRETGFETLPEEVRRESVQYTERGYAQSLELLAAWLRAQEVPG